MFSYIHLNPVSLVQSDWKEKGINNKKEIKKYLEKYELSSYKDYLGQNRKEKSIISLENFPEYFQEKKDFELFIEDWITMSRLNLDI